ncbi:MAG: monovalent cation/H(+) antiporter subunit G [Verrucomicrobiota bacterium]|nr:monovalent cation/H(+) antiporter subunit G [Limisphaera sp.]MDW8382155.1 monovalent cation/H(+) antiporter subunit G [Verrucomicrobiota bacterium]
MIEWITGGLLLAGVALMLLAAVGLLRLPDFLCRSHAVAKATTLGIALILLAAALRAESEPGRVKLLLAMLFQLGTIPVAGHVMGLIAYRKNLPRWRERPIADHRGSNLADTGSGASSADGLRAH